MGLDIYAGTLTRYYSHNWKTVVQKWAEENGYTFNRITTDGEHADNEEKLSPSEVQAAVENWRYKILNAISQSDQLYTPWPEDNQRPYYTDKPDWDAFGAMLLVAACHTYGELVPLTVGIRIGFSWIILWSSGLHRMRSRCCHPVSGGNLVASTNRQLSFPIHLPTDDQTMIATLGGLRKELEKLNHLAWQADEDTILG